MSHPYLFVNPDRIEDNKIILKEKGNISHLRGSLRCRPGDAVIFSDNESHKYRTVIQKFEGCTHRDAYAVFIPIASVYRM